MSMTPQHLNLGGAPGPPCPACQLQGAPPLLGCWVMLQGLFNGLAAAAAAAPALLHSQQLDNRILIVLLYIFATAATTAVTIDCP